MRTTKRVVAVATVVTFCFMPVLVVTQADPALSYLSEHTPQYTQELVDLVKIPSISSLPGMITLESFKHFK